MSICVIRTSCTKALNPRTLSLQEQVQTVLAGMAVVSSIPGASGVQIPLRSESERAEVKSNGCAKPLGLDSCGSCRPSEPTQALVEASCESPPGPERCPLESRGISIKGLVNKVKGKARRVAKWMNASMLQGWHVPKVRYNKYGSNGSM